MRPWAGPSHADAAEQPSRGGPARLWGNARLRGSANAAAQPPPPAPSVNTHNAIPRLRQAARWLRELGLRSLPRGAGCGVRAALQGGARTPAGAEGALETTGRWREAAAREGVPQSLGRSRPRARGRQEGQGRPTRGRSALGDAGAGGKDRRGAEGEKHCIYRPARGPSS